MLTSAKLRGPWYLKVYFLKLHIEYLHAKFQVSSIILTIFRHWGEGRGGGGGGNFTRLVLNLIIQGEILVLVSKMLG